MKFDTLVESLLLEMPHVSFNSSGKILNINLEMEKFKNNYEGFLEHVKSMMVKMNSAQVHNDFIKELQKNQQVSLFLQKIFQKSLNQFLNDLKI